ncbi:MAG TPA: polysaccharide deacetylase family protein [Coriobacteriia bacterium]
MPENSRMQMRRQMRRTTSRGALALAGVVVLLIAAGLVGGAMWLASRSHGTLRARAVTSAGASQTAGLNPRKPSALASSASATPAAAPGVTPTAAPETLAAADASARAVAKAAVPFPHAPSISPKTPSLNHLNPRHKYIALTLDDGYNFQPALLKLLKQYDVHCTTFLIGSWAASHKQDLKMMRDAGFEIGNHSWTHPFLTKLSTSQIESELTRTQRAITSITGNQAPYLRPPFGATNSHVKAAAASLGYRIVMWDRTFGDSGRGATPKKLYDNVVNSNGGVQPGDIILCHWGSKPSYEALKKILPDLQAQGYQFVTLSELIADSKPQE